MSQLDSPFAFIGDVVDEAVKIDYKSVSITDLAEGRGMSEQIADTDSPTLSGTSSDDESQENIDHTAALLGYMDEFEEDDDDEREIAGFSPSASLDLELEHGDDAEDNTSRFERIWSGDELEDGTSRRAHNDMPMQSDIVAAATKKCVSLDELEDNGTPVRKPRAIRITKHAISTNASNPKKQLSDDASFFYFDSKLVAAAVEEYGQRKRADIDNKRKQAAMKAAALKDKASSAISLKAKKALALPQTIKARKARKQQCNSHDERDDNGSKLSETEVLSKRKLASLKALAMKEKAKLAVKEKTTKAMDKVSIANAIKDRNTKKLQSQDGLDEDDVDQQKSFMQMYNSVKMPSLPTFEGLASKASLSVIGDLDKMVKRKSSVNIKEDTHPGSKAKSAPPIMQCLSNVSSANSQMSCIDQDGFLISPTSSIDATEASFASEDGFTPLPKPPIGSISRRQHLPPSGKKQGTAPPVIKLKKPRDGAVVKTPKSNSHRRSQTAVF
eukprot:scaffold13329_cov209-Alexandrium_tamarense.AAC.24